MTFLPLSGDDFSYIILFFGSYGRLPSPDFYMTFVLTIKQKLLCSSTISTKCKSRVIYNLAVIDVLPLLLTIQKPGKMKSLKSNLKNRIKTNNLYLNWSSRKPTLFITICFLFLFSFVEMHAKSTLKGRIVYGAIDESKENDLFSDGDDLEVTSIFQRGLSVGTGVPFVTVELRTTLGKLVDSDITDAQGYYELSSTDDNPSPNRLKILAENAYCIVKKAKPIPLATDKALRVTYTLNNDLYDESIINLEQIEISDFDSDHIFNTAWGLGNDIYLSRALYVAGAIHRGARHIEEISGSSLDMVWVRYGWSLFGNAYYDAFLTLANNTIHLPWDATYAIDHEYGHHIERSLGAFGMFPSYTFTGSHSFCSVESECWAFIEGLATFYGAINSQGFIDVDGVDFFGKPTDTDGDTNPWTGSNFAEDPATTLGGDWWVEGYYEEHDLCSDPIPFSDRAANEGVVAQVLWDLVDDNIETKNHFGLLSSLSNEVPEIAQVDIQNVLEVLTAVIPMNSPCDGWDMYQYPITLDQFCETYIEKFIDKVYPDLYSAFVFNGVNSSCVSDTEGPEEPHISSSTHIIGEWTNKTSMFVSIGDGNDDFSGSYYYYNTFDDKDDTSLSEEMIESMSLLFESKEQVNTATLPVFEEGEHVYLHVQTIDLARHLGSTGHYGPLKIDLTDPIFEEETKFPDPSEDYLIGTYVEVTWKAWDELSGIDHIKISYGDPTNSLENELQELVFEASGSAEFYLNPDVVVPSTTGNIILRAYDKAGNSIVESSENLTIVSPFSGPYGFGFDTRNIRVISGDIDGDGFDEVIMSGRMEGNKRALKVIHFHPFEIIEDLSPGVEGGDLFLADADRDGDLDLFAGGYYGSEGRQIYLHKNDGTGKLTSFGPLPLPNISSMKKMVLRVVDLYGTGEPVLVYGGVASGVNELSAYNLVKDIHEYIAGVEFRGGDFEVGDINADGIFDFVTLGYDVSGTGSVRMYPGEYTDNGLKWSLEGESTLDIFPHEGDVDLGNIDDDRDLELFMMYRYSNGVSEKNVTGVWDWTGGAFIQTIKASTKNRISDGDGHIAAIYNDGRSDVFAMGYKQTLDRFSSWYLSNFETGKQEGSGIPFPNKEYLLRDTDTAFGDFDGDGDLDMIVSGEDNSGSDITYWYENMVSDYGNPNATPLPPTDINVSAYDPVLGGYLVSWFPPSEDVDETAIDELQYEIRVDSAEALKNIVSWAHPAGQRQQVAANIIDGHFERFVPLLPGSYLFDVRTVDNGWKRSDPATTLAKGSSTTRLKKESSSFTDIPPLDLHLFPNPASKQVRVTWKSDAPTLMLSVFDSKGTLLINKRIKKRDQVDISELSAGVYFYKAIDEEGQILTRKLVVKK